MLCISDTSVPVTIGFHIMLVPIEPFMESEENSKSDLHSAMSV